MRAVRWGSGLAVMVTLLASPATCGPVELAYLYDLADFTGKIPYSDARVAVDRERSEVYTLFGNEVRVFNNTGMQIFRFTVDLEMGRVVDLGVESGGDILMLAIDLPSATARTDWSLLRADYRGRPLREVPLDRPAEAEGLLPNRLLIRGGRIWLVSESQLRAACFLPDGTLERLLDLADLAGVAPAERGDAEIRGFDVGEDGTIVFAVPVQFRVHAVDPDGGVRSFGRAGSAAGNFGVLGGVAIDVEGNIYVSDRQRSVVMVFSREFRFLRETARTAEREQLVRPGDLGLDPAGRLYVSQVRDRGIAVYSVLPAP